MLVGLLDVSAFLACCRVGSPPTQSGDPRDDQNAFSSRGQMGDKVCGNIPC
jgi:hypothetical protein